MATPLDVPRLLNASELAPKERVVQAGLLLLNTWRRLPTQDEVVACLRAAQPSETGTGKGTVNKYWPEFSLAVGQALAKERWLPDVPKKVEDALSTIVGWAQDNSDAQLKQERIDLEARAAEVAEAQAALAKEKVLFQTRITELTEQLAEVKADRASLSQTLATAQAERDRAQLAWADLREKNAVTESELKHLEDKVDALVEHRDALKNKVTQLEATQADQHHQIDRLSKANDNKAQQVIALQTRNEELTQKADDRLADWREAQSEVASHQETILELQDRWREADQERKLLQQDKDRLERQGQSLQDQIARLERQVDEHSQVIERLSRGFHLEQEQDGVPPSKPPREADDV